MNRFLSAAAISGLLAVIIGAFGAHGLENSLSAHALQRYHTGVEYQFYHVAALLAIAILHVSKPSRLLSMAGYAFILGMVLFSGSLYLYAITGKTLFGMITPVGGLSFMIGWIALFIYSLKEK